MTCRRASSALPQSRISLSKRPQPRHISPASRQQRRTHGEAISCVPFSKRTFSTPAEFSRSRSRSLSSKMSSTACCTVSTRSWKRASVKLIADVLEKFRCCRKVPGSLGQRSRATQSGAPERGANRPLKNVGEAGKTRQKQARKHSLRAVNEHSEPVFNAVLPTQVVFQRPAKRLFSTTDRTRRTSIERSIQRSTHMIRTSPGRGQSPAGRESRRIGKASGGRYTPAQSCFITRTLPLSGCLQIVITQT